MKILYLVDPVRDTTSFLLYLGLAKEIGVDNIDVYPWTQVYVSGDTKSALTYVWMNAAVAALSRTTGPIGEPWAAGYKLVVSGVGGKAIEALDEVIAKNGRWGISKLAFVDGGDVDTVPKIDRVVRFTPNAYCKVLSEENRGQLGELAVNFPPLVSGIESALASEETLARVFAHGRARARLLLAAVGLLSGGGV